MAAQSSLAVKGLQTLAGVIDADYVGAIRVLMRNDNYEATTLNAQDCIARFVILSDQKGQWHQLDALPPVIMSERGFSPAELKVGARAYGSSSPLTAAPPKVEAVAKGSHNIFAVMFPGEEKN